MAIAPLLQHGELASTVTDMASSYYPMFVDYFKESTIVSKLVVLGGLFALITAFALAHNFVNGLSYRIRLGFAKLFRTYERDIHYKDHSNHHYSTAEETTVNKTIIRSIRLRIYREFRNSELNTGTVSLIDMKEPFASQDGAFRSVDALKKMELVGFPTEDTWFEIPNQVPKILLRHSTNRSVDGSNMSREMQMTLRCQANDGDKVIKEFVKSCHRGLIQHTKDNKDSCRYFYQLQNFGAESESGISVPMFKRFPISDDRDFETMFFPEKLSITRLVDNFTNKTGKFGIEGFPHKLGLLLHGPPGTGKTTFVKSLATHLKRHIVSIPLGKIKKNQQLYDIMFEGVYHVEGDSEGPYDLDLKNVVFLMEEIDAASNVVKTRCEEPTAVKTLQVDEEAEEDIPEEAEEDIPEEAEEDIPEEETKPQESEGEGKDGVDEQADNGANKEVASDDEEKDESSSSSSSEAAGGYDLPRPARGGRGRGGRRGRGGYNPYGGGKKDKKKKKKEEASGLDALDNFDLAGLLNVLDGVVDSPERVVLMTTNHPEKLDPALIRPGRINTSLHLGFMKNRELFEMIRHHFGAEAFATMDTRIKNVLQTKEKESQRTEGKSFRITPAEVEQLCAESDTIEEFATALNFFPKVGGLVGSAAEGMNE